MGSPPKLICDGSSFGSPPYGAIGVVFRASQSMFVGTFSQNIEHASSLEAEFSACMYATEKAKELQLTRIWLETDSLSVVKAFKTGLGVPWRMKIRWHNCLLYCTSITFICTHVFREGNMIADALAKNGKGLALYSSQWWDAPPSLISSLYNRDRLGLPFSKTLMD